MEQFSYTPKSNFLEFPGQKEDVYEASLSLANYLKTEKINNVMFLDNSARQAYVGLKEAWKKVGDEDKSPNIYFISPDVVRWGDFSEAEEEFRDKYKHLDPEEPILIYDVCIHTGGSLLRTKEFLEYLGFKDVRTGVTSFDAEFPEKRHGEVDLVSLDHRAKAGCHPFGRPKYIENNPENIVSQRSDDKTQRERGKVEHQKIKDVFNDQYEKNNR